MVRKGLTMHESPRTIPCRYQLRVAYAYMHAPHQQHSHLLHVGIKYACITSTAFTFAHLLQLSTTANQPSLHSPFLLVLSFSHNHPLPSLLAVCSFFLGFAFSSLDVHCRNKITGHRCAWHFRLEKAQKLSSHACPISIRKELG